MKPSPVQARLLRYSSEHPELCVRLWFATTEWMPTEPGRERERYSRSFAPVEHFGRLTISSCARLGWLRRVPGPADDRLYGSDTNVSYFVLSDDGAKALAKLQPVDFEQKPRPSVAGEAGRVKRALGNRHARPEWVFLTEAPVFVAHHGVGGPVVQHVDALALNCWYTKHFASVGYEVKVSRSDFLNELRHPAKTAASARYCSAFYFAVPSGLVKPTEVPDPYGLVVVGPKGGTRIAKRSTLERPEPTWGLLAFLLRRILDEETTTLGGVVHG
jgi:hypothetical protein